MTRRRGRRARARQGLPYAIDAPCSAISWTISLLQMLLQHGKQEIQETPVTPTLLRQRQPCQLHRHLELPLQHQWH